MYVTVCVYIYIYMYMLSYIDVILHVHFYFFQKKQQLWSMQILGHLDKSGDTRRATFAEEMPHRNDRRRLGGVERTCKKVPLEMYI